VEFKLEAEPRGEVGLPESREEEEECFEGGETVFAVLRAESEAAGAGHGEAHGAAPILHLVEHATGLPPTGVEQENL
jgi:hypothetical protein